MSLNVLLVCHMTPQDGGTFVDLLEARGATITTVMGYHDRLAGIDPLAHDLTIVMGGSMGVYQADLFPYLDNEITYLQKRLAADRPTLGICLGAQLMAKALGKDVYPGGQGKEVGWRPIDVLDKRTPLRHLDGSIGDVMHWHGDTFDLPDSATLIAKTDQYPQAFTHGRRAMALQCHIEVNEDILEYWLAGEYAYLEKNGGSVHAMREQTLEKLGTLKKQTALFFNEWLDEVAA